MVSRNYLEVIKMTLKELSKTELEAMSYDDIAHMILTESNKQMKLNELFKQVCDLLGLSENEFVEKLPAFFEVLSTDQRFIMLESGMWDLKSKHSTKVVIDPEEEEEEIIDEEEDAILEDDTEEEKDIYAEEDETEDIDSDDDDLKDLVIIDEEEANGLA